MDWPTYKAWCDRPDVFSRWMLTQTRELLTDGRLRALLDAALLAPPIAKPSDHKGDAMTDMFVVDIGVADAEAIAGAVSTAVAEGTLTSGTRTRPRALGGFEAAWNELVELGRDRSRGR